MEHLLSFLETLPVWTPQAIYVSLLVIGLGKDLSRHGEVRISGDKPVQELTSTVITIFLLIWGGFFLTFKTPQIIYSFIFLLGAGYRVSGKKQETIVSFGTSFLVRAFILGLLFWGGFFSF